MNCQQVAPLTNSIMRIPLSQGVAVLGFAQAEPHHTPTTPNLASRACPMRTLFCTRSHNFSNTYYLIFYKKSPQTNV